MKLIKKVDICNFRGFSKLELRDLNKINLFFGKNNSGKSSVLEAIFLIVGMSNPTLPESIFRFRGGNIRTGEDFKFLFHKLKFSNKPELKCVFSDFSERSLILNPLYKQNIYSETKNQKIIDEKISLDVSTASPNVTGLELQFSSRQRNKPKQAFKSSIVFNPPEIIQTQANNYKEDMHAVFISSSGNNDINALARYSDIVKRKKGDLILKALQKIDPNIEYIHPLPDGVYFSYRNIEELVPISLAGDGVRRYFNIVTTIADKPDSIILIDEIENGLHYSAHLLLWESIFSISKEFNVQLFISTHSIETLKSLKAVLEEECNIKDQENLSVYTIADTKKEGTKAYKYSYTGFRDAIETETELRS